MSSHVIRRVVVTCDVGPDIGAGHVMRCLALSEELLARGAEVRLLGDLGSVPWVRSLAEQLGIAHESAPARTSDLRDRIGALAPDLVVVDSYLLPSEAYAELRSRHPVLAFVDGDPVGREADVILDQNFEAELDRWPLPPDTTRLAGLRYCQLRREIRAHRPASRPAARRGATPEVFAFFGGTDIVGAAPAVLAALVATGERFEATVVAANEELRAALEALETQPGQRITTMGPTSELADRVLAADLVLAAAGSSIWELMSLGAAMAVLCVAENQVPAYGRIVASGTAAGLGTITELRADPSTATSTMARLLADPDRRSELAAAGWELVDGRGAERVVDRCEELVQGWSLSERPV